MEEVKKKKIAIIEDERDTAELIKLHLEKADYEVFIFDNVTNATQQYLNGDFNLTLLDLNLGKTENITGEQFISILRKFQSTIPIIIISGEGEDRIIKAMQTTGAICYFKKPLKINEIVRKINKILSSND